MAIGCLLMSVLPRFPNRTIDNQYHLQALRHLYILSVEWRALRIVDADTNESVNGADVLVELRNGEKYVCKSPCLLRELSSISRIRLHAVGGHGVGLASSVNREYFPACLEFAPEGSDTSSRPTTTSAARQSAGQLQVLPTLFIKRRPRAVPLRHPLTTAETVLSAPLRAPVTHGQRLTSSDASELQMICRLYTRCAAVRALIHQQSVVDNATGVTYSEGPGSALLCEASLISLVGLHEEL